MIQIMSDSPTEEVGLMCSCGCDLWIELASIAARSECALSKAGAASPDAPDNDGVVDRSGATAGAVETGFVLKVVAKCFDWFAGPEPARLTKARS